jgi:hypothetical protein
MLYAHSELAVYPAAPVWTSAAIQKSVRASATHAAQVSGSRRWYREVFMEFASAAAAARYGLIEVDSLRHSVVGGTHNVVSA